MEQTQETNDNQDDVEVEVKEVAPKPKKLEKYRNTPEYNKAYYQKTRLKTLERLTAKVECEKCKRVVSYQRLPIHHRSKICLKLSQICPVIS
jgi:hypothetical protein